LNFRLRILIDFLEVDLWLTNLPEKLKNDSSSAVYVRDPFYTSSLVGMTNFTGLPFPEFSQGNQYLSTNTNSNYTSMQATFNHQFRSGVDLAANYTYAKCVTDFDNSLLSGIGGPRAEWLPGWGIGKDYALCNNFVNNVVHVYGEYALPLGRGRTFLRNSNRAVDAILGGWELNYIFTYQSGQPFNVGCPSSTLDFGCDAFLVPGQNLYEPKSAQL
jgi:hypothetical protein